jgi:hypothetical protein
MPSKKLARQGVTTKKFDSCVSKVKAKGGANAYAVCNTSLDKSKRKKK